MSRSREPARSTPSATREVLLATAERLFAEHGLGVSNRQIGEAAGQGNNSVVGYHFGTKTDLVRAIVRRHEPDVERRRELRIAGLAARPDLGAWLESIVRPITDHLDALGAPTWYARFLAQASTDPVMRPLLEAEALAAPSMRRIERGLVRLVRGLTRPVFSERADMMRHVIAHTCAERERALQLSARTPRATWTQAASGIVDALVGLWRAPIRRTRPSPTSRRRST